MTVILFCYFQNLNPGEEFTHLGLVGPVWASKFKTSIFRVKILLLSDYCEQFHDFNLHNFLMSEIHFITKVIIC